MVRKHIDFSEPIALFQCGTLHHYNGESARARSCRSTSTRCRPAPTWRSAHFFDPETDEHSELARKMEDIFVHSPMGTGTLPHAQARSRACSHGLELVEPGLALCADWWPDGPRVKPLTPVSVLHRRERSAASLSRGPIGLSSTVRTTKISLLGIPGRMTEVTLLVDGGAVDEAGLDRLTSSLFKDLRTTGLVKVVKKEENAPAGSKSGTAAMLGELVLTGVFSTATVATLGKVITAYIGRTKARSVVWQDGDRKVELTGVSKKDQLALVELLAEPEDGDPKQPNSPKQLSE